MIEYEQPLKQNPAVLDYFSKRSNNAMLPSWSTPYWSHCQVLEEKLKVTTKDASFVPLMDLMLKRYYSLVNKLMDENASLKQRLKEFEEEKVAREHEQSEPTTTTPTQKTPSSYVEADVSTDDKIDIDKVKNKESTEGTEHGEKKITVVSNLGVKISSKRSKNTKVTNENDNNKNNHSENASEETSNSLKESPSDLLEQSYDYHSIRKIQTTKSSAAVSTSLDSYERHFNELGRRLWNMVQQVEQITDEYDVVSTYPRLHVFLVKLNIALESLHENYVALSNDILNEFHEETSFSQNTNSIISQLEEEKKEMQRCFDADLAKYADLCEKAESLIIMQNKSDIHKQNKILEKKISVMEEKMYVQSLSYSNALRDVEAEFIKISKKGKKSS